MVPSAPLLVLRGRDLFGQLQGCYPWCRPKGSCLWGREWGGLVKVDVRACAVTVVPEMHALVSLCMFIQIMAKGETERGNGKQARETIFYLNRFTSHRAAKTWGNRKLFYSKLFSSTICSVSNDSKWFTSDSFVFLFIRNDQYSKSSRRLTITLRFRVHSVVITEKNLDFSWTRLGKDLRNLSAAILRGNWKIQKYR